MTWFVYQVTNRQNGKRYIGKTNDVSRRWYDHRYASTHNSNFYFHRAIKKHGHDNFVVSILAEFQDESSALVRERELIKEFNTQNPKFGYNTAEGGLGGNTMTFEQLEAQYMIKAEKYQEFRQEFDKGTTQKQIAKIFDVSIKAVISCAKRLNLSFKDRRSEKKVIRRSRIANAQASIAEKRRDALTIRNVKKQLQKYTKLKPGTQLKFRFYSKQSQNSVLKKPQKRTLKHKTTIKTKRSCKSKKNKMTPDELSNFRANVAIRTNKARGVSDEVQQQIKHLYFNEGLTAKQIAEQLSVKHGSVRSTISRAYASMTINERLQVGKNNGAWSKEADK